MINAVFFVLGFVSRLILGQEFPFDSYCSTDLGYLVCIDPFTGCDFQLVGHPTDWRLGNRSASEELFSQYVQNAINARAGEVSTISKDEHIMTNRSAKEENIPKFIQKAINIRASEVSAISKVEHTMTNLMTTISNWISNSCSNAFNCLKGSSNSRSVCLKNRGSDLCVLWVVYNPSQLPDGSSALTGKFGSECIATGGRAQVKVSTSDYLEYACVSDRDAEI